MASRTAELGGPVTDLIGWLHGRPVADLSIPEPDLDRLFMRYYEASEVLR